jgi:hypothetical protein
VPIRTPRGRAAAYRPIWQWPLRSPARLGLTLAGVVAIAVGVSLAIGALGGTAPGTGLLSTGASSDGGTRAGSRSTAGAVATPAPTLLPPAADPAPSTLPLSEAPAAAIDLAARWSAAWLRPAAGTTGAQWLEGLRPYTTEEYLSTLTNVDPANVPATRVTGEARPVRVAAGSVQVEVPTDAVTLLVLVVETDTGWRVAGHDQA